MTKLIGLVLGATLAMMSTPTAVGFHGSPYMVTGTIDIAGATWDMRLEWGGSGTYRVLLTEPTTATTLPAITIQGVEDPLRSCCLWTSAGRCDGGMLENLGHDPSRPYSGKDKQTNGELLRFTGIQENCHRFVTDMRHMHLVGTLYDVWEFDVGLGQPFGTPWEF